MDATLAARGDGADRDVVSASQVAVRGQEFAFPDDQGVVDAQVQFVKQLQDGFDFGECKLLFRRAECYGDHGVAV